MHALCPEYASRFKCKADKCLDNCCIGWEIGIDGESLTRYRAMRGELGRRLKDGICESEEGACFRLTPDRRCPFLDGHGLCDIIKEKGETALCDVCREHPRYYNVLSDRVEWGVGLSCEEAAVLILGCEDIRSTIRTDTDDEGEEADAELEEFLLFVRERIYELLYESEYSLPERIEALLIYAEAVDDAIDRRDFGALYPVMPLNSPKKLNTGRHSEEYYSFSNALHLFLEMDFIDAEFKKRLAKRAQIDAPLPHPDRDSERMMTRLVAYFTHRYLVSARFDGIVIPWVKLAAVSAEVIFSLVGNGADITLWTDTAKAYSKEVEYNEENRDMLLDMFSTEYEFSSHSISRYFR